MHLCRSDDRRPSQAALVMVGFGDARHHAGDADAVGSHPHWGGLAILVKHLQSQRVGVLQTQLEHLSDLHTTFEAQRAGTVRAHVAMANLHRLDGAVGLEITAVHEIVVVDLVFVRAGEPCGTTGDMRVDEVTQRVAGLGRVLGLLAATRLRTEHHRSDVSLDEFGMLLQILLVGLFDLGRSELGLKTLHIDGAVARNADHDEFAPRFVVVLILRMHDGDDDVLQNVGALPIAAIGTRMVGIGEFDHLVDGGGVRGRALLGGRSVGEVHRFRFRSVQSLDVPSLAGRRLGEGVLADLHRGEELLGFEAAHRTGHGVHRHVFQVKTVEDALVCAALVHVGLDDSLFVEGEGIGVLHDEFAAADEARARTELVAVLGLDLIQGHRQVLVRGVQVLDQQGEHLLMGRRQQVVGVVTVLETEDVVAVFLPTVGGLIRLTRKQAGEMDLLGADRSQFLADDRLDLVQNIQAQRQPGPDARSGLAQIAGALQQLVRHDVGIGGVLAQRAQEHGRHTKCFSHTLQITQASRLPARGNASFLEITANTHA